jgi:GAF domain-containing protein
VSTAPLAMVIEPRRVAAVRASRLANPIAEDAFDRLVELAAAASGAPFAFLTIVDDRRSWLKSCVGRPEGAARSLPVESTFCQYVVATSAPLVVEDSLLDERVAGNPAIELLGVRAWAGFPILSSDVLCLGVLCLVDLQPRRWSDFDLQLLSTLAAAASTEVRLRHLVLEAGGSE